MVADPSLLVKGTLSGVQDRRRRFLASAGLLPVRVGGIGASALSLLAVDAQASTDTARSALVIGNAAYPTAPLRNPINDARLVADTLRELDFDVRLVENGTLPAMLSSVRQWLDDSAQASVRAFYFAGHGTQYRGNNFLVPVDLKISEENQIERKALRLSDVVQSLSSQAKGVNFVIVDACRTDPTALITRTGRRTRGIDDPLKPGFVPEIAPRGTVVAYSTSPGSLAADGIGARNSVFSRALANNLRREGITVESMFKQIRVAVMRATRNAQVPWETSSLVGDFCFRPNANGRCGPS